MYERIRLIETIMPRNEVFPYRAICVQALQLNRTKWWLFIKRSNYARNESAELVLMILHEFLYFHCGYIVEIVLAW